MSEPVTVGFALLSMLLAIGGTAGGAITAYAISGYVRGMSR